ncbi:MAG: UDP-N-acetylmuramoyl-L-alanine--D-glutamate ligase [Halobacteriovoraceae bacterium]|nr:UDP-N-acetylmuramoyl-L-alanine--D-glutamate ligase [Halobacteriovoraceae bacterium]|tara:strand:+ start:8502 stop:9881 length:1380 start_codon:yes stop_codon:yes gene_type:complete
MEKYRGKKILIVGLGKTGFALIHLFNQFECHIKVTDIKPIFDLNKAVKRLKKVRPTPQMTLGEHREEDFLEADVIVYSSSVNPNLPQLQKAREHGREVYSEFAFAYTNCDKPVIAVCGSKGRTTIAHMIGFTLKLDQKNVFVGGTNTEPFSNFLVHPNKDFIDYVVVEVSPLQLQSLDNFHPIMAVYPNIEERTVDGRFNTAGEYIENSLKVLKNITADDYLVINFDKLSSNSILRNTNAQTFWYSRRSFVKMGVIGEIQGTHFHDKRIHSNIHFHSEYRVKDMRIIGQNNRENLLAAITACKALKVSDNAIQRCIETFPGIPHRMEFVIEKSGVKFYDDAKSEKMSDLRETLQNLKPPVILITGGRDTEQEYEGYDDIIKEKVRLMVLVGEAKENMNRVIGNATQTFLVGSFDESVLLAFQKSRTGDTIILCPGNDSTDVFRDYEEKGNYYKKLIFQL